MLLTKCWKNNETSFFESRDYMLDSEPLGNFLMKWFVGLQIPQLTFIYVEHIAQFFHWPLLSQFLSWGLWFQGCYGSSVVKLSHRVLSIHGIIFLTTLIFVHYENAFTYLLTYKNGT